MRHFNQTFAVIGPAAWAILGGFVAVVGASVAALVTRLRAAEPRPILPALAPALGCLALIALGGLSAVESGRALVVQPFQPGDLAPPADVATRVAMGAGRELEAIGLAALSLQWGVALVAGFAAALAVRAAQKRGEPWLPALAAPIALGAPVVLWAVAASRYAHGLVRGFEMIAAVDTTAKGEVLRAMLDEARAPLLSLRLVALAAAGLFGAGLIGAVLASGRRAKPVGGGMLAAASALLLIGIGAFAATRARASDAALPFEASPGLSAAQLGPAPLLAQASCPAPARNVQELTLRDGTLRYRWRKVTPTEAVDALASPRRVGSEAGGPAALIVAPADAPASAIAELSRTLLAARDPGLRQVALAARAERFLDTRTLGRLELPAPCALPLSLDAAGVPLARYGSIGDLARALAASPTPPAIAP